MFESLNLPTPRPGQPEFGNRFTRWLGCAWLKVFGWRFKGTFPDARKLVVAVAPHTSNWDFPLGLAAAFGMRIKFNWLGKHTLFRKPFSGLMKRLGGIPVNRKAPIGVVGQVLRRFEESEWVYLVISPEGTRSRVERWKTGFLRIAKAAKVPIQLICFDYAKRLIEAGPLMEATDDLEADLARVRDWYSTVTPRVPANF